MIRALLLTLILATPSFASQIIIKRENIVGNRILGTLTYPGMYSIRVLESKELAIPKGIYKIEFTYSPRFKRIMPLVDVPQRVGIRLHWGTKVLEGCIGMDRVSFDLLYAAIKDDKDLSIKVE